MDVPAERLVFWFDDDCQLSSPIFKDAFSVRKLATLDQFNRYCKTRLNALPTGGGATKIPASTEWSAPCEHARRAITQLR